MRSPDWPGTHFVDQVVSTFSCVPTFGVLGLHTPPCPCLSFFEVTHTYKHLCIHFYTCLACLFAVLGNQTQSKHSATRLHQLLYLSLLFETGLHRLLKELRRFSPPIYPKIEEWKENVFRNTLLSNLCQINVAIELIFLKQISMFFVNVKFKWIQAKPDAPNFRYGIKDQWHPSYLRTKWRKAVLRK